MRSTLFLVIFFIGCAETSSPAVAVAVDPITPANLAPAIATTPVAQSKRCHAKLVAGRLKTPPTCLIDERITKTSGRLEYPCDGNGPAVARFGEHAYEGEMRGGTLDLRTTAELDWDDGCHWTSRHTLTGSPAEKELHWDYTESAEPNGGAAVTCLPPCTATADISIKESDEE